MELLDKFHVTQKVLEHTRVTSKSKSCIDNVILCSDLSFANVSVLSEEIADHLILCWAGGAIMARMTVNGLAVSAG